MDDKRATYTLPGVMHYLQTEWATNHRDRIILRSELEEMKAQVARLTSENNGLRQLNTRIQRELDSVKGTNVNGKSGATVSKSGSNGVDGDLLATDLNTVELAPLVQAKQHLEDKLREVVFLLKGTDADLKAQFEADRQRALLMGSDRKDSSRASNSMENDLHNMFASPAPESPEYIISPHIPADADIDVTGDIDTDNETVIGHDDFPLAKPPLESHVTKTIASFTLAAHASQVTSLAVLGDSLLSLSEHGNVMRWDLSAVSKGGNKHKELSIYHTHEDSFLVKWIDPQHFAVVSPRQVAFWNVDRTLSGTLTVHSTINQVLSNSKFVVIKCGKTVKVLQLDFTNKKMTWSENDLSDKVQCEAMDLVSNNLYVKSSSCVEVFDLSDDNKLLKSIPLNEITLNGDIVTMHTHDSLELFTFITSDQAIVYDPSSNTTLFELESNGIIDLITTKDHYIAMFGNGIVNVFDLDGSLVSRLNHYDTLLKGLDVDQLHDKADRDLFDSSGSVGAGYKEKHILTGGGDGMIRGYVV